jgi:hypothetical protein
LNTVSYEQLSEIRDLLFLSETFVGPYEIQRVLQIRMTSVGKREM